MHTVRQRRQEPSASSTILDNSPAMEGERLYRCRLTSHERETAREDTSREKTCTTKEETNTRRSRCARQENFTAVAAIPCDTTKTNAAVPYVVLAIPLTVESTTMTFRVF